MFLFDAPSSGAALTVPAVFAVSARYMVGRPEPLVCGQTIVGSDVASGHILSPTYPGVYPDNLNCFYRILGEPGQRIKLSFQDLDLYSGGEQ